MDRFGHPGAHVQAPNELTDLLNAARSGDQDASRQVYELVYAELKRAARAALRRGTAANTLTPTVLVHEVFLRFSGRAAAPVRDRGHFYALAARAMRQIVVDQARRRGAEKRGGGLQVADFEQALSFEAADSASALALDVALTSLEARDPDLAGLVESRFFAGLTFQEIAELSGRSERSLRRDWELARSYLQRRLRESDPA